MKKSLLLWFYFFFQAEDGIRDLTVTGVQTCALPIWTGSARSRSPADRGGVGRWRDAHARRSGATAPAFGRGRRPADRDSAIFGRAARQEIGRASCRERVLRGGGGGRRKKKKEACVAV